MKTVKKAYQVVDPTIWENNTESRDIWDNAELIYAETQSKAKALLRDKESYLNIKTKRDKELDIVLYNGKETKRYLIKKQQEQAKRKEQILSKLLALPENEMYYIQDNRGYVGNSVLWWGYDGNGYTTELNKAQKYSREEVIKHFVDGRHSDVIWRASHVETKIRTHVDMQYLELENSIR
jgi:hypothetical protein